MFARRPGTLAAATLADSRAAVARGKADVEAGRVVDAEDAFAELESHFRALARGGKPEIWDSNQFRPVGLHSP